MSKGSPTAPRWNEQIHDKARLYRYFCLQGQLSRDADAQNQTGLKSAQMLNSKTWTGKKR
eukprot:scaffold37231_cov15-Tisochrysis_lutea.AAC.1